MKFEKDYIIKEIIRTTQENGGKPLGQHKFESETGIKKYDWFGKYWSKWGDALTEAGYQPNTLQGAYEEDFLIEKLIHLTREIGKFPSSGDLTLKSYNDKDFPSHNTFSRLGKQKENIAKVINYCNKHEGFEDVLEICLPLLDAAKENANDKIVLETTNFGFVYLMKSGKFYKIGRSNDADRRAYELRIILPEKLEVIHKIKTDDPIGIEEYWHKRFRDKRKSGEWFELTRQDIEIFKRRKFM
jgi:hypothetical protein